jgi:hypothetical protein
MERKIGKPAWQPGDRILLAGLSRLLPRSAFSSPRRSQTTWRQASVGSLG